MPRPYRMLRLLGIAAIVLIAPGLARSQVSNGGSIVAVYNAGLRIPFATVAQPDSGALVLFQDTRDGVADIYAQRLDRHGRPLLAPDGVLIWRLPPGEYLETWLLDGSGGVILVQTEQRGATGRDIVLKRVLGNGTQSYGPTGIVICNAARDQAHPRLAAGPAGFYYVGWSDDRPNLGINEQDVYVQKVSLAGAPQWAANGILVNTATYRTDYNGISCMAADFQNGVIVGWYFNSGSRGTRMQRVNSAGAIQWAAAGVQFGPDNWGVSSFAADGTGGIWGTTTDWDGTYIRAYAHRLLANGTPAFALPGILLHSPSYQSSYSLYPIRNGTGGCFIYGIDYYNSTSSTRPIFRQELSPTGTLLRGTDGEPFGDGAQLPAIFDAGTALLMANQEKVTIEGRVKLRLQRYAIDGTAFYPALGVVLGRNEPNLDILYAAMSMLPNGVIAAAWADGRYKSPLNTYNYQAFGQAITPAGTSLWDDSELPVIQAATDAAADQGGMVRVTWNASIADHPATNAATGYHVWRALPGSMVASLATVRPEGEGTFKVGDRTLMFRANVFWEQAGSQSAATLPSYALTVPTLQDSMAGAPGDQSFMVEAYDDSSHHWFSSTLNAHSVDNLAPAAITSAAGIYGSGATTLYWGGVSDADLCCYEVFRGTSPAFVPSDANRITSTDQVSFVDPYGTPAYYRIAARDIHGNRGASALVIPAGTLAADADAPRAWALHSRWNASGRTLELALDLPQSAEGRLDLFDVTGRRLWSAPYRVEAARSLQFRVAGGTELPAGVVFARATDTSGRALTSRAVVLR